MFMCYLNLVLTLKISLNEPDLFYDATQKALWPSMRVWMGGGGSGIHYSLKI